MKLLDYALPGHCEHHDIPQHLLASRHETDVDRNLEPVTDNGIGHIAHPFAIDYCFSTTTGLAYTIEAGIKIVL